MKTTMILVALVLSLSPAAFAGENPWTAFQPLVGQWQGTGAGFGSTSQVWHTWEFVLGGNFLRLVTRSISIREDGSEDVHEDVGFLSFDTDREAFVFRQFLTEGYVNTYDLVVSAEGSVIDFGYREAESAGEMRARMKLTFKGNDAYEMVLDLAFPGKDFKACQRMEMAR